MIGSFVNCCWGGEDGDGKCGANVGKSSSGSSVTGFASSNDLCGWIAGIAFNGAGLPWSGRLILTTPGLGRTLSLRNWGPAEIAPGIDILWGTGPLNCARVAAIVADRKIWIIK